MSIEPQFLVEGQNYSVRALSYGAWRDTTSPCFDNEVRIRLGGGYFGIVRSADVREPPALVGLFPMVVDGHFQVLNIGACLNARNQVVEAL